MSSRSIKPWGLVSGFLRWLLPSNPRATMLAAVAICGMLGGLSLLVPPAMYSDEGWGFLTWRGTLMGAPNSIVVPDPEDIRFDTYHFDTVWSPGHYLIPGAISLLGIPWGIAITLTVMLCLLACLLGWLLVFKQFAPGLVALPVMLLIGTFRFSTLPFGIYNGGEILLQGATPWIVLAAYRIPQLNAVGAAATAAGIVLLAFFAKLSGLIVAGSALLAGGMVSLAPSHRLRPGTIGGAAGALSVVGLIHVFYLSRGWNASKDWDWSLPIGKILFAIAVPWVAGTSWTDWLAWLFLYPARPIFNGPEALVWFVLPIAICVFALVIFKGPRSGPQAELIRFSLWFYAVTALTLIFLWVHGAAAVPVDERHFREAGILLFVCCYIRTIGSMVPLRVRVLFLMFCGCMSLYGIMSFSNRAWAAADGHALDRASRTNQPLVDRAAIEFLQNASAQEGGRAVFVLPSPDIGVTLPVNARIIAVHLDFEPESRIARLHYNGRATGHVFVLMQNRLADGAKGRALLSAFSSYSIDGWERKTFSSSSVFIQ